MIEKKKLQDFFEELRGNNELTDFYDLVNTPLSKASEIDEDMSLISASRPH